MKVGKDEKDDTVDKERSGEDSKSVKSSKAEKTFVQKKQNTNKEEISWIYNDPEFPIGNTSMSIIVVDQDYCIRYFTPAATDIFHLEASDKIHPLQNITHKLQYDDLLNDVNRVLAQQDEIHKVVVTADSRCYLMRMSPYDSAGENSMTGVVIVFEEFSQLREARETFKQQRHQETLAALGIYALEQEDLEVVMHRAIQQSCMALQLECAFIAELNRENDTLQIVSESDCGCKDREIENNIKWDIGYALQSEKPVNVSNYNEETRFSISPIMEDVEYASSVLIAIRGVEDTHGVFGFYAEEKREFTESDLNFIRVVANIIGMAIERKQAKTQLKEANAKLKKEMERSKKYQKDILKNNIVERWELGGYLHDNLGQMLASAKIITYEIEKKLAESKIDITEETTKLNSILDEGIEGIRNLTHDIIPVDIEEEGVAYAFRFLIRQTQKLYDVDCILEMDEIINEVKNRKLATHLYHVIQEAIKNAVMHGEADTIKVAVTKSNKNLIIFVTDDGIGLSNSMEGNGKGLRIMEYRVELLGGTFDIEEISDSGESGTSLTIKVPIEKINGDME